MTNKKQVCISPVQPMIQWYHISPLTSAANKGHGWGFIRGKREKGNLWLIICCNAKKSILLFVFMFLISLSVVLCFILFYFFYHSGFTFS